MRCGIRVTDGRGIYHLEYLKNNSLEEFNTLFSPPISPILCGNYFNREVSLSIIGGKRKSFCEIVAKAFRFYAAHKTAIFE
jgi:hypothetical protein